MKTLKKTIQLFCLTLLFFGTYPKASAQIINPIDHAALIDLLNSTNGNGLGGWNLSLPVAEQWGVNPAVQWRGITMNAQGRVTKIILDSVGLTGTLPANLFSGTRLSMLSDLILSNNQLTGHLNGVDWFDVSHTRIRKINLSHNNFTYHSDFLRNLTDGAVNLDRLDLVNYLDQASAPYPSVPTLPIEGLKLALGDNGFTGDLPDLGTLGTHYVDVDFDDNNFTSLGTQTIDPDNDINHLDLRNNDIIDASEIKNLILTWDNLQKFHAASVLDESISRDITEVFTGFSASAGLSDKSIELSSNNLTGTLDLMLFTNCKDVKFADNQLSVLTDVTTVLPQLKKLHIDHNLFSQTFPEETFDNLPNLEELYMHNNQFYGELPVPFNGTAYEFGNMKRLNMSHNKFEGDLNLEWLLDAQDDATPKIIELHFNSNEFTTASFASPSENFVNLMYVDVDSNYLHFDDLYIIATGLNMLRIYPNGLGLAGHYAPIGNPDTLAFDYHPQYGVWEGGVRRRDNGAATVFKAEIRAPLWVNNYNYYDWYREDIANGGSEYFGRVSTDGVSTTIGGTPTVTVTPGTYQLSPGGLFDKRQHLYLDPVDMTYDNWSYKGCASNDTFPLTSICTQYKKFVIGPCYDSLGQKIRCQEMIVQFVDGTTDEDKDSLRTELNIERIDSCMCGSVELWALSDTTYQLEVEQDGSGTRKAVSNAGSRPSLLGVDPNYSLVDAMALVAGDSTPTAPTGNTTPSAALIAIIDSGVDYDHPDVSDRIVINTGDLTFDGIDDDGNCVIDDAYGYNALDEGTVPFDDHGHGTSIAGIVAGRSSPNVHPNAGAHDAVAILPVKYTGRDGRGTSFNAACAVRYAADYVDPFTGSEVRVINASWGYYGESSVVLEEAIRYAGQDCSVLFVCSSGNDGIDNDTTNHYPSNYTLENILTVGALQNGNQLAGYSNYGATSVDIAAPGTAVTAQAQAGASGGTHSATGTSMATAQVARAAGWLYHNYPASSYRAVRHALISSATTLIGPDSAKLSSGGKLNLAGAQTALQANDRRMACMPTVHLKARLEGALKSDGTMNAGLYISGQLPNSQPYNVAPWNYNGSETITANFNGVANVRPVDWVLLRFDTKQGNHSMYVAGLLQSDGSIVDGAGHAIELPETYPDRDYYVTIIHRNHLGLTSRRPLTFEYPRTHIDLSDISAGAPATSQYKNVFSYRALIAGDANGDGQINPVDRNISRPSNIMVVGSNGLPLTGGAVTSGYAAGDYNMDGVVDNADRAFWEINMSLETDCKGCYEDSSN